MPRFIIGGLLVVHGLVTVTQSTGVFGRGTDDPAWLGWWPTPMGRSWLLGSLGLERTAASWLAGAPWMIGGIAFPGAGSPIDGTGGAAREEDAPYGRGAAILGVVALTAAVLWWRSRERRGRA